MKTKKDKDQEILHEMYRRAFAASNPPADFDELLENAELDEYGRKKIPFLDHECSQQKMEEIFDSVIEEYKVPKNKIKAFNFGFWLGCSPKTAKDE